MPLAPSTPWTTAIANAMPFPAFRHAPQTRVWGDGLCEGSLGTLLYPATWDSVDDDELVFLLPSLTSRWLGAAGTPPQRLAELVLKAIDGALLETLEAMAGGRPGALDAAARQAAIGFIVSTGVLATSRPGAFAAIDQDWAIMPATLVRAPRHACCATGESGFRLAVLAALDRLYSAACASARERETSPVPPLQDVALASIHSRINGAYVYPGHAGNHELLAASAWLGHLLAGRSAYMPRAVADGLCGLLWDDGGTDGWTDRTRALVCWHADWAGGRARLLAIARRVSQSGHVEHVVCGRRRANTIWTSPLLAAFMPPPIPELPN